MTEDEARIVLDTPGLFASRVHVTSAAGGRFVRLTFTEVLAGVDRPRAAVVLAIDDAKELASLLVGVLTPSKPATQPVAASQALADTNGAAPIVIEADKAA